MCCVMFCYIPRECNLLIDLNLFFLISSHEVSSWTSDYCSDFSWLGGIRGQKTEWERKENKWVEGVPLLILCSASFLSANSFCCYSTSPPLLSSNLLCVHSEFDVLTERSLMWEVNIRESPAVHSILLFFIAPHHHHLPLIPLLLFLCVPFTPFFLSGINK